MGYKWANSKFYKAAMFILPQQCLEGVRMPNLLEGGKRSSLGKQSLQRANLSVPTCTARDGAKPLRRGREAYMSGRAPPRKARMVIFPRDGHSQSVNTQEPFSVFTTQ